MKKIYLFIYLVVCTQVVNAQVYVRYNTNKEKLEKLEHIKKFIPNSLSAKILPSFDYAQLITEDKAREHPGLPARYGKKFDVQWSLSNSGTWSELEGNKIWHLKIHSPGAYSLGLLFEKFYLPDEATFLIYNEPESFMYGPLTSNSNKIHEKFSTGPIQGETIILELTVPKILQNKVKLQINGIIHGYKDLFKTQVGYNDSGSCLDYNDVECFDNPDWDDESDAVVRLINGIYYGSGALVNNTANDYTPYLLTAFHNIDVDDSDAISATEEQAVANCLFQFHYKSPTCNGSNSSYIQFTGGDLVASLYDSDFALIDLDNSPVGNENITYLGWDNRNNTPTSGTVIHHPSGDVMKISLSNTSPNIVGNLWEYQFYSGITEGGSSGAPVLNQSNRVVGQLLGTYAGDPISCSNQDGLTLYGKFDISWDDNSNNDNQLAHWLDPDNTGDPTTDLLRSPSITVPDLICYSGTTVSMQNPPGVTITWGGENVEYPNGDTGTSVTVRANSSSISAEGTVTASFTINDIQRTITHPVWVGTLDENKIVYSRQGQASGAWAQYHVLCHEGTTHAVAGYDSDGDGFNIGDEQSLANQSILEYDWDVPVGWSWNTTYGGGVDNEEVEISPNWGTNPSPGDMVQIGIRVRNGCGWTNWEYNNWAVINCDGGGLLLSFSPNPTTGETTLTIESGTETESLNSASISEDTFDYNAEWDMEIYSPMQALKAQKANLKGKSTTIQTAGWTEGVYTVRVKYKDEILTGKLIVKR